MTEMIADGNTIPMAERKRTKAIIVRLADEERAMLQAVAEHDGLNVSDWIRRTVRVAFRKAFGADTKPRKRKN